MKMKVIAVLLVLIIGLFTVPVIHAETEVIDLTAGRHDLIGTGAIAEVTGGLLLEAQSTVFMDEIHISITADGFPEDLAPGQYPDSDTINGYSYSRFFPYDELPDVECGRYYVIIHVEAGDETAWAGVLWGGESLNHGKAFGFVTDSFCSPA